MVSGDGSSGAPRTCRHLLPCQPPSLACPSASCALHPPSSPSSRPLPWLQRVYVGMWGSVSGEQQRWRQLRYRTRTCVSHGAGEARGQGSRRRLPTRYYSCCHQHDTSTRPRSMNSTCRWGERGQGGMVDGTTAALCNLLSQSHNSPECSSPTAPGTSVPQPHRSPTWPQHHRHSSSSDRSSRSSL